VTAGPYDDLVDHLVRSTPLSEGEARRVVAEVLGYFAEPVVDYVRRRHTELKRRGLTNDHIFAALRAELVARRFGPPELSARQLRRIVYG
jgi:polyhydroxyalkanoate synthesis regulator phasin